MTNNTLKEIQHPQRWDIFCTVVDNFGDIGVCWRLAKQLANEHNLHVRLWVDNLVSFQRLCPEIDSDISLQSCRNVEIQHWTPETTALKSPEIADVIIEAFACQLPAAYEKAMAQRGNKPVWINLEYLSAEDWITGCHSMPSQHPQYPLTKYFFFPGFAAGTGGLLRERDLLSRRNFFQRDKQETERLWLSLGLPPTRENELRISLFSYENKDLENLIRAWSHSDRPISCLVPEGRTSQQLIKILAPETDKTNRSFTLGNLNMHILPFVEQEQYDQLLWACDVNFVRGEDSFVRAQWAGQPFVWHIYPQDEEAHMIKLDAFLDLFTQGLPAHASIALREFWNAWNRQENTVKAWPAFMELLDQLPDHMDNWVERMSLHGDISNNLVHFCKKYA